MPEYQWYNRFPHFLQPVVGETDLQILADFRSGFPFSAVTETGNLASARCAAFPALWHRERRTGAPLSFPRLLVGGACERGQRDESPELECCE